MKTNTDSTRQTKVSPLILKEGYSTEITKFNTKQAVEIDDEMRFTPPDVRPTLTPLGHRLLHLSERKLASYDYPLGYREEVNAMWKGVIVRETIRSAWKFDEEGSEGDLTDWRSKGAMDLDVIGEEGDGEEDGEVTTPKGEEMWFEETIRRLGEDEVD